MHVALAGAIKDNADIKKALGKVDYARDMYNSAVIKLSVMLGVDASLKKQRDDMLDWVLIGTPWHTKHKECLDRRVQGIGDWVFRAYEFRAWHEDECRVLLCDGAG